MTRYRFEQIAVNSTAKKKPEDSDRERYIGLEHLDPGTLEVSRWGAEVTPKGDKLLMEKGDVLFGRRRAYQKKVGIAPFDGIFSAHGMVLRPRTDVVDQGFFPFFISSDMFLDEAIRVSVGSLSPTANWKDLKVLEFSLPSLDKQRELAGILSEAERLKGRYRSLLAACDDVVKSQFVEMFGDPVRGKSKFSKSKLGELAAISSGATPKRDHPEYYGGSIPWVKTTEVARGNVTAAEEYITQAGLANSSCRLVPAGSVLVAMYGQGETRGKAAMLEIEAATNQACAAIECDPAKLDASYALHHLHLCYEDLRSKSKGGNQKNLSLAVLKQYGLICPPLSLQKEFAEFAASVDKSKFAVQKALDELNAATKKILNQELGFRDV